MAYNKKIKKGINLISNLLGTATKKVDNLIPKGTSKKSNDNKNLYVAEAQGALINIPSNPAYDADKKAANKEFELRTIRKDNLDTYNLFKKVQSGQASNLEVAEFGARARTFTSGISDEAVSIGFDALQKGYDEFVVGGEYNPQKAAARIEVANLLKKDMQRRKEFAAIFDEGNYDLYSDIYGIVDNSLKTIDNYKKRMEEAGSKENYERMRSYSNFSSYEEARKKLVELENRKYEYENSAMNNVPVPENEIAQIDEAIDYIYNNAFNENIFSTMSAEDVKDFERRLKQLNNKKQWLADEYGRLSAPPQDIFDDSYDYDKINAEKERLKTQHNELDKLTTGLEFYLYKQKKMVEAYDKWEKLVSENDDATPNEDYIADPIFVAVNYKKMLPTIGTDIDISSEVVTFITPEERRMYNRILNKYGKEKAYEFISDIEPLLNMRWSLDKERKSAEFASDHEVLAWFGNRLANVVNTVTGIGNNVINIGTTLTGGEIDPYDPRFIGHRTASAREAAISDSIDSKAGKIAYQVLAQVTDLVATMAISGGIGKAAGAISSSANATQIASKVANISNQILLSSNTMLDTTLKYKENGASDTAALGMGLISGIVEAWTERKSMSNLLKSPSLYKELTKKEFVKAFAKKLGVDFAREGWEEVESNLLNTFAALIFRQRNNDSFLSAYDKAILDGKSESDALIEAIKTVSPEYFESFVVGGFAGIAFGGYNAISGRSTYTRARDAAEAYFVENGYSDESLFGLMTTQSNNPSDALAMAETVQKATRGELSGKEAEALSDNPVLSGVFTAYKKGYAPRTNVETETLPDESVNVPEYKSELDRIIHQPTLSNKNIEDIINNESAREEFQTLTGVKLEGTKAEMREAVKQWKLIEDYKQRQKDNRGKKWVTVEESKARRDENPEIPNVPEMSKENAQQIISGTDIESATRSEGRQGAKVTSNAYDTTNPSSFISKLIKEGYSEEKASALIDGIYSFMYARGREGADLQETLGAVRAEIFDGVAKYENDLKAFYMAGVRDSSNWMRGNKNAKVIQSETLKRLLKEKKIDHKTIRAMNAIARKLGIDIIFADDVDGDGEFNTKTGVLRINANAEKIFFVTAVHESIHALRTIDPESYNKITDMVYEVLNKNEEVFSKAWGKTLAIYKKEATDKDGNVNKDYIDEELNAKVISELLTNEEFIKELAKQDIGLVKRILNMLVDLFDKIVVRYSEKSNSSYEVYQAVKALKNEFNTIKTMYQTALESTESMQGETIESGLQEGVFNKGTEYDSEMEREYLELAEDPEKNKVRLREMLDEAAKEAGLPTRVLHGTRNFGFTVPDVSKSDDKISFFATDSPNTASAYRKDLSEETNTIGVQQKKTTSQIKSEVISYTNEITDFFDKYTEAKGWYDRYDIIDTTMDVVDELRDDVWFKPFSDVDDAINYLYRFEFFCNNKFNEFSEVYYNENYDENEIRYDVFERSETYEKLRSEFFSHANKIIEVVKSELPQRRNGTYDLYANTEDNVVIEGNNAMWDEIPLGEYAEQYVDWLTNEEGRIIPPGFNNTASTRDIAKFMHFLGKSGVTFRNIIDAPPVSKTIHPSTVYAFFNPQKQVRSADLVTYDDRGNIIPLSERFNLDSKDIRWSKQSVEKNEEVALENVNIEYDSESDSVAPVFYSRNTWEQSEYVQDEAAAVSALVKAINVSEKDARRYINNINSIAKLIADDKARLDYEPNVDDFASVLKSNSEYKWTVDMSTMCAKRLLFTGTFDAIQKKMPNRAFNSEEIVALRSMMMEKGYEVACGICYVESTRREIGPITEEFIKRYKVSQDTGKPISRLNSKGQEITLKKTKAQMKITADKSSDMFVADKNYTPTLADLNTTDIDVVKTEHPLVYEAYLNFMNARGQAKPKLLETRAEYKGEILKHFKSKNAVNARNRSGGLRVQSFSDFEVAHLIDMMQIALDMSRVGLMSQAYTKVPEFAEVFGNTGIKINLSLIAKDSGLDKNGNLIFDDVEGMPHKRAFELRKKYSKNVGTILVGKNNAHIKAALADSRIDFVIPFHKSSWKESLYVALGLTGYEDYTDFQNEKPWDTSRKIKNFQPSEYWDENLSGYENAQIYLKKCFEDQRTPKFPQFAKEEGYWKLLIDFKMYDNDGNFSPQTKVMPEFNMEKASEILNSYKGGHQSLPVANDVVNDFVNVFKSKSESDTDVSIDTNITPGKRRTTAQKTQGAFQLKEEVRKKLEQQSKKYGEMEKGEMPSRNVTIPKETDAGKVRTFQRTAIEADSVSDEAAREIAESIANEELTSVYSVVSNKKVYEESKRLLEVRGFDSMLNEWEALLESGRKIEKQDISNAMLLVTEAGKNGDTETEVRILTQLAAEATAAGQSVQAFSLLKRLGPNAQTYAMNRTIERIKRNIDKKYGKQIEVPEELLTQYEEALKKEREAGNGNTVESDKYVDQIMRNIGEQIPANWLDKWNAWRMLSMLGNAKTHIRNFGSNVLMWPVRFFKDMNAIVLERVFLDKSKRTKTLKGQFTRGDILNFAKEDAKKIESVLRGESKYGDLGGFGNMQDYRRIFKTDWLEAASKKNSELLEKEDWWGLKLHYARAFTNYVVSQNIDVNNMTDKQLATARKIAVKEAQKATFRDANAVATWLNSAHDKSEVLGFAVDAVMPFKKTPMNVLKRGVEYSPVGLIKSLSWGIYQVRSGKINANEFIDGIAAGVTGTGLMLIGMLLKSAGLLRGVGDDDENEGRLSKLVGKQNYALVIGDHSYTIEWLSPSAMPLFVGCEFMGLLNEENISLGEFVKSFSRVLEPAFEMSMLKSINDLLSVALYEDLSSAALTSLGLEIPLEYLGQSVPTALGQVAKTIDNTRRKTYIKKDGWMSLVPDFVQSFIQQQMKKIPFLTFAFEEYVNEKGQTEKNAEGNIFSRVLQNFISPGYYKKVKSTAVDEEISRLYKTVDGASGIIPKTAKKTIKVDGKDYHLSAEQHNTYQEEMGKTYYEKAKEIITSDYYKGLSDSEKVKLLEKAMEYAGDKGKHKAVPEYKIENGWLKTAMEIPGGYKYLIETNKSAKFSEKDLESDAFDNYESQRDSMFRDILSNSELPTEDDAFMDKYYANLYQFTEDVALEANSDGQFTIDTKWINEIKGLSAEQQAEYIYGKTLRSMYDTDAEANTAINNDPNISSAIKLKLLNDVTVIPKSPEKSYKEHNLTKYKISSDTWLDVYNEYNKIKEIKQPNGKTLSKKDQIIMYINSKKISDEQKSALYRALGYKDTGKNLKVPWSYRFDLTNPTDYADALGFKIAYTNTSNYNNNATRGQCVWYARGRAKEKLSVNIPPLGNANQMYASAKPEARLEVKKSNIKPNTLVTYKVGTSEAGQTAGHVIYIEDVVGDTVYYTEGGYGNSNGVVKKSTKDNIMKGLSGNNSTIGTYINGIIDVTKY